MLLLVRNVPEMSAVNGVSAAVNILPLPSLLGDSVVIGVPVFFSNYAAVSDFAVVGVPAIEGVLADAGVPGIYLIDVSND